MNYYNEIRNRLINNEVYKKVYLFNYSKRCDNVAPIIY